MRRAEIAQQNRYLIRQQRQFRLAADIVAEAWMGFAEVHAIAVIGSVAKLLWKEIPRFSAFRRQRIEVWHECADLDLALWIDAQDRLREIRRAGDRALRTACEAGADMSVADRQVDVFLFDPATNDYLGRLCKFNQCPKEKHDCLVPGCGAIPFNRVFPDFVPRDDLLAGAQDAMLYRRGEGRLRSALDLPSLEDEQNTTGRAQHGAVENK